MSFKTSFLVLFGLLFAAATVNASAVNMSAPNIPLSHRSHNDTSNHTLVPRIHDKFRYHLNVVEFFQWPPLETITFSHYKIREYMVSHGQDPDGLIVRDKRVPFRNVHPWHQLAFELGRHGTHDVAEWWDVRFRDFENTFNHHATKLNFAFLGDLHGTHWDTGVERPWVVRNLGLAQGHSGATNNWWVAVQGARRTRGNMIHVPAEGIQMCFSFYRGVDWKPDDREWHYRPRHKREKLPQGEGRGHGRDRGEARYNTVNLPNEVRVHIKRFCGWEYDEHTLGKGELDLEDSEPLWGSET